MEKEQFYDMINRVIGDRVFQYEGPIVGIDSTKVLMDFKIKLSGDVELLSRGKPKNYIGIDVSILKITPPMFDGLILDIENNRYEIADKMYLLASRLENYIRSVLDYFSVDDYPVLTSIRFIGKRFDMKDYLEKKEYLKTMTESIKPRGVVRSIVNDIVKIFKEEGVGNFELPEDINGNMTYEFKGIDSQLTVELNIIKTNEVDGLDVDGSYYKDEDVLEIEIEYNPSYGNQIMYDLVGKLNEVVRHELQHVIQFERGDDLPDSETDPEKYYSQKHELEAQIRGLKRLSKLKREPFEKTVRDWFDGNEKKHNLSSESKERVIQKILKMRNFNF